MIRRALGRCAHIAGASVRVCAVLLFIFVMLALFTLAMVCALIRLAYNAPMIAWRAANNKAPRP